jgi:hypothetical protein
MWLVRDGSSTTGTIGGETRNGWCIGIADKFGVTKEGKVYATDGEFTGKITATSGFLQSIEISNGPPEENNLIYIQKDEKDYEGFYRGVNWEDRQQPPYDGYSIYNDYTTTGSISGMSYETI